MFMYLLFSVFFLLTLFFFVYFFLYYVNWEFSISFISFGGKFWGINLHWDFVTMFIVLMLLICFCYVCFYTPHYFNNDLSGYNLSNIIYLFVAIMASLVMTGDFLTTLIFWEYLGVVSFFLILFYSNYLSLRSSVITLVSSRFGDVCLFFLISLCVYNNSIAMFSLILFFFVIFTKSAGFPFISWLLEAMRAPTPVSSLVHSSTLVAAGVWFALRYDFLLYFTNSFMFSLLLLLTIIITGVCCFFFMDLKKIVALSTCNNIAWCVLYMIFGDTLLSLFQLISHGVSKCMLFMLVGDIMSGTGGSQSSNCVYASNLYSNWGIFSLFSVVVGLSGVPFIGVFFTKHFLLTNFMGANNIMLYVTVMICIFLSYFYSFRLCSILLNIKSSVATGVLYFFNSGIITYFWLFINYILSLMLDESVTLLTTSSIYLILFQLLSCITAYLFYDSIVLDNWSSSLFGCDNLVETMFSIYNSVLNTVNLFLYRWDNYIISLFYGIGSSTNNLYTANLLNILLMSSIFILIAICVFI